jgi:uncharacterized protein
MTAPSWLDHACVALLVIGLPAHGAITYRWFVRDVRAGVAGARVREYRRTVAMQWGLVGLVLAAWLTAGRPLAPAWPSLLQLGAGLAITAAGLVVLRAQLRAIARLSAEDRAVLHAQLLPLAELIPRTPSERRWFRAMACTAGICEEILYRAFLHAYLSHYVGWLATLALAAGCFGLAHAYQGPRGVAKTSVVGLLAGVLYEATGLLLWPIVLHAAVDLQAGEIGHRELGRAE